MKSNKTLSENKIKNKIEHLLLKYKHGNHVRKWTIKNSKTNESHKFNLELLQKLDLRSSNKHHVLLNLSVYYTWKNIRRQCKNNKLKIIVPTWNDEFELPDCSYSVSDIQDYIEYIIKK